MLDDEKTHPTEEIIKILNSYKDDTAEKFILDLYEKNNYRLCVTEELYLEICKQNNIANTNDFLKFLVLKNYIRKKSDSESTNKAEDLYSDDILNEYVNQLKEEKNYYIKFYKEDLTLYTLKKNKELQEQTQEIFDKIKDYNKENLTIMGLLVSVVSIILTNVFNIANNIELKNIIVGNASIILGISAIFLFINIIFDKSKQDKEKYKQIWIIIVIAVAIMLLTVLLPNSISLKMIIGG